MYCSDMATAVNDLAEEYAKGDKADQKTLLDTLNKRNNCCLNCHSDFRNDP